MQISPLNRRAFVVGLASAAAHSAFGAATPTDWHFAAHMLDAAYVDMPYLASVPGAIISTVTYNTNAIEGGADQHVAVLRSTDDGATWSAPIDIEPASNPESSWAMPFYDATNGKLYVFYVYNFEDVRSIPNSNGVGSSSRVDSIGKIAYKVSTDGGLTFGSRTLITLPATTIDNRNPYSGAKQLLWLFGHPVLHDGKLYLGYSKMGEVVGGNLFVDTMAFVLRMDLGASGVSNFAVLPSDGIRLPTPFWGGPAMTITEEPSVVVHNDGVINVFSRTDRGRLGESYSTDGGATFTNDWARQTGGALTVYHPRGPAFAFELPDGRFLLWTYNNNESGFGGRNPVWYRLGQRVGNRIQWGAPKALLYYQDMDTRIGYPSAVVVGDDLLVAASNKTSARCWRVPLADL